jgi:type I pantothenate kinase
MTDISPPPIDRAAALLAERAGARRPCIVGITGSVAVGKTTFCAALIDRLPSGLVAETISTDGFLMPNSRLEPAGLLMRKGFPETYDAPLFRETLARARTGPATIPAHSHVIYDIDPALARTIDRPDVLLVEGLGLEGEVAHGLDLLIYLDASEADLETWFVRRFMGFWHAAADDPASFYVRFRTMDEPQAVEFARSVWTGVNLPNLREHIVLARDRADVVLHKDAGHALSIVRGL